MPEDKAKAIVNSLLENEDLYKKMSTKEGDIWGKVFSNQDRNQALQDDQLAASKLKINRNKPALPKLLKKHGNNLVNGLSLACGSGRAERMLLKAGICQTFSGFDLSESALNEAREMAKGEALSISYEQADINSIQLNENAFDLVVTQNCLHHVLKLEHLAEQISKALRPNGLLWIHDYIGETQFQYNDERLAIVNEILKILPERFRQNKVNQRTVDSMVRRNPGTLISPFEAIRSAEIMPIFLQHFDIIEKYEDSSILGFVCPVGTRDQFLQNEESRTIFELLLLVDRLLIENEILLPTSGMYLLRRKVNSN